MTTFRTIVLGLAAVLIAACGNGQRVLSVGDLPREAQAVLAESFARKTVSTVIRDGRDYEVIFVDADRIEFNHSGEWVEVTCRIDGVPGGLVPQPIARYVADNYPGVFVKGLEKDGKRMDVELSNGLELTFDKNMRLVKVDD